MRHCLLFVLALATACGGKIAPSTDDTGGTSVPGPSSAVGSSPEPLPPPSSAPIPPSRPPPPSAAGYSVYAWAGDLDHVEILKADTAANTCVHLFLSSPEKPRSNVTFAELYTPDTWAVTRGERTNSAVNCVAQAPRAEATPATGGKGFITLEGFGPNSLPCRVNIHASVFFENIKVTERLDADNLPVTGCL